MAELLSEIKWEQWVGQPLDKMINTVKKKKPTFLEEQIRDTAPCDVEPKEEKNEKF